MRRTAWTRGVFGLVLLLGGADALAAQADGYPVLSRDEELRLAMSAGPLAISANADVYVLGKSGFEKVIPGSNGYACLVVRSATNRIQLAPHCLNPDAVKTVLPAFVLEATLQAKGMDGAAIDAELKRQFASGALPTPSGPAHAYMLSSGQRLGESGGSFRPHFMLYVPYATNASVGGDPAHMEFPFVGPYENHPLSTVVILMPEFVNPADVKLPAR